MFNDQINISFFSNAYHFFEMKNLRTHFIASGGENILLLSTVVLVHNKTPNSFLLSLHFTHHSTLSPFTLTSVTSTLWSLLSGFIISLFFLIFSLWIRWFWYLSSALVSFISLCIRLPISACTTANDGIPFILQMKTLFVINTSSLPFSFYQWAYRGPCFLATVTIATINMRIYSLDSQMSFPLFIPTHC